MITKKIRNEIDKNIPDVKNKIKQKINCDTSQQKCKLSRKKFTFYFAMAACFILMILLGGLSPLFISKPLANYNLTLSINPSITLTIENNIVTKQIALNKDAQKLLFKENLVGMTELQASKHIINLANKYGYISQNTEIKLWVSNTPKGKNNKKSFENISSNILTILKESSYENIDITELKYEELCNLIDSYSEENFNNYDKEIHEEFVNQLKIAVQQKINETVQLSNLLKPYISDSDSKLNAELTNEINKYGIKYNFTIEDVDFNNILISDVENIVEELIDVSDELIEILEDLNEGVDEDDFEDALEDLMEIVKYLINTEEDDD